MDGILLLGGLTYNTSTSNGVTTTTITAAGDSTLPAGTLYYGHSFTATFASATGTYTTPLPSGGYSFDLTLNNLVLTIGEGLKINVGGLHFQFTPAGVAGPSSPAALNLALTGAAPVISSATLSGLSTTTSLTGLTLRSDGFSFNAATVNSTGAVSLTVGGYPVLGASSASLTVSGPNSTSPFNVTYSGTPSVAGSVNLTLTGLALFPNASALTTQFGALTASYGFNTFDGQNASGQLKLTVTGFHLTIGEAVELSANQVILQPGQSVMATIPSLTVTSPQFGGFGSLNLVNFQLSQSGFSLGSLTLSSQAATTTTIGNIVGFDNASVSLTNFAFNNSATPSISGTVGVSATNAVLFPDISFLGVHIGSLSGSYGLNTANHYVLSLTVTNLNVNIGDALQVQMGAVTLQPGQTTIASVTSASVVSNVLSGFQASAEAVTITQTGLSLGTFTLSSAAGLSIGSVLSFDNTSKLVVSGFQLNTSDHWGTVSVAGSITATLNNLKLFPGGTGNSTTGSVSATFDDSGNNFTGRLSLTVTNLSMTIGGIVSLAASKVVFNPGSTITDTFNASTTAPLTAVTLSNVPQDPTQVTVVLTTTNGTTTSSSLVSASQYSISGKTISFNAPISQNGTLTVTYGVVPGSSAAPLMTLGTATVTVLPLNGAAVSLSSLVVTRDGFSLANATVTPNTPFNALGGVLALTNPTVSLNNVSYSISQGKLAGTVGFTATGATLDFGGGVQASIQHNPAVVADNYALSGSFNLGGSTRTLTLNLESFHLALPFAVLDASGVFFSYTPSSNSSDPAVMLLGMSGASLFVGNNSSGTPTGLQISGGTLGLELEHTSTPATSYAFYATGNIAVVGLPPGSLSLSGTATVTLNNIGASLNLSVPLSTGTVAYAFTGTDAGTVSAMNLQLSVGGFVSVTGNFSATNNSGTVLLSATGINLFFGTDDHTAGGNNGVGVSITNASVSLQISQTSTGASVYALDAEGAVSLLGLSAFTPSFTGGSPVADLQVNTTGTAITNFPVTGNTLAANVPLSVSVQGLNLAIPGFASISGNFTFQRLAPVLVGTVSTTDFLLGASGVTVFVGTNQGTASETGLKVTGAELGLLLVRQYDSSTSTQTGLQYALTTSAGSALLEGVTGLHLGAVGTSSAVPGLVANANTTGAAVNQAILTPDSAVTLAFTDGSNGTVDQRNFAAVQGHVVVSDDNLASLEGDFGFQITTHGAVTTILAGATNVSAVLGDSNTNLTISGASLGLLINKGSGAATYALETNGGTDTLNGLGDLTLTGSGLAVKINNTGTAVTDNSGNPLTAPAGPGQTVTLDFRATGTANVEDIDGSATLTVHSFATLSGNFSFSKVVDTADHLVKLLIGATQVNLFWGSPDQSFGMTVSNGQLLLAVYEDTSVTRAPDSYALEASGAVGLTAFGEVTASGSFDARLSSNTPAAITSESISVGGITQTLNITPGTPLAVTVSSATLQFGSFATVTGTFGVQKTDVVASGASQVTQEIFTVSGTGIGASVGLVEGGTVTEGVSLSGASFGLLVEKNLTGASGSTYALATSGGTATFVLPGMNLTATGLAIRINTTGSPVPSQTIGSVTVAFADGSTVYDVEGTVSGSIYNPGSSTDPFVTLSGAFGFQKTVDAQGVTEILAGANNVGLVLGTSDTNLTISGASLALLVRKAPGQAASYALAASGGTDTFNGLPSDLSFTVNSLTVKVNNTGLAVTTLVSPAQTVHTPGGNVALDFSSLGAGNVEDIEGTATLALGNSGLATNALQLSGSFAFRQTTNSTTGVTKILVGISNFQTFIGSPDGSSFGLRLTGGQLGLVVYRATSPTPSTTYALTGSGTITAVGLPADLSATLTGALMVNTTGAAVNESIQTPGGLVNVVFTDGSNGSADQRSYKSFTGSVQFSFGGFANLSGNFSFSSSTAAPVTKILISVSGLSGSANDGTTAASLSGGSLGLVIYYSSLTNTSSGYAFVATGTATVLTGTATATIRRNTTTSAVSETAGGIAISFSSSEVASRSAGTVFQQVTISGISTGIPGLDSILSTLTINVGANTSITINASNGQFTNLALGNFLLLSNLSLSGTLTLSSGVWTGSLTVNSLTAMLFPAHSFSATVSLGSTPSTFTFNSDGSYSLNFYLNFSLTVGQALQLNATNGHFQFASTTTGGLPSGEQTLMTVGSVTASSPQFNVNGTVTNLVVRNDGFSFDSVSLSATNVQLGNVLSADSVSLALTNGPFNVTYAASGPSDIGNGGSTTTPTLSLTVTNLRLFPVGGFITTSVGSLTAYYDFSGFDGLSPSGTLRLVIQNLSLTLGDSVQVNVPTITITPSASVLASVPSATVSFPLFNGLGALNLSNFQLLPTGFTIGSLSFATGATQTVNIGGLLQLGGLDVSVSNFAFNYASSASAVSVSGSITVSANTVSVFPGLAFLSVQASGFNASYAFDSTHGSQLNVHFDDLKLVLANILTLDAGLVDLKPGQNPVVTVASVSASANFFGTQFTGNITNLDLGRNGLSFDSATLATASTGTSLGNFLSIQSASLTFTGTGVGSRFVIDLTNAANPVSGTISATLTGLSLFPGSSVTTGGTAVATYTFGSAASSGSLSITITNFVLSVGGVLEIDSPSVTLTPDTTPNDTFAVSAGTSSETLSHSVSDPSQILVTLQTGSSTSVIAASQYSLNGSKLNFQTPLAAGTLNVFYNPTLATISSATVKVPIAQQPGGEPLEPGHHQSRFQHQQRHRVGVVGNPGRPAEYSVAYGGVQQPHLPQWGHLDRNGARDGRRGVADAGCGCGHDFP